MHHAPTVCQLTFINLRCSEVGCTLYVERIQAQGVQTPFQPSESSWFLPDQALMTSKTKRSTLVVVEPFSQLPVASRISAGLPEPQFLG